MKKLRFIALILAMMTVLTMLSGCVKIVIDPNGNDTTESQETADTTPADTTADTEAVETPEETPSFDTSSSKGFVGFTATKIGTINRDTITPTEFGIYYEDNGKYGVMTYDGKKDTGAIYASCSLNGQYFAVSTTEDRSVTDVASLNNLGLIDAEGKTLIPMKYAIVEVLNERYAQVCEVTEQTTNRDEAIVWYTDGAFTLTALDVDMFFKGKWYVYDLETGFIVDGASGTVTTSVIACGNYIKFFDEVKGYYVTVDCKGEEKPQNIHLLNNGYYTITGNGSCVCYTTDGNKLFEYDGDSYELYSASGHYLIGRRSGGNYDDDTYVVVDISGKVVSVEFPEIYEIYGEFVCCEDKLYDFSGNEVVSGTYDGMYYDETFGKGLMLEADYTYTVLNGDGTVLYKAAEDDMLTFVYNNFAIEKYDYDYNNKSYSFAEKDFTINGSAFAPWLIKAETNSSSSNNIVDSITGEILIKGYKNYLYSDAPGYAIYVYAVSSDGTYDVYLVQ